MGRCLFSLVGGYLYWWAFALIVGHLFSLVGGHLCSWVFIMMRQLSLPLVWCSGVQLVGACYMCCHCLDDVAC